MGWYYRGFSSKKNNLCHPKINSTRRRQH